ncbi:LiaG family protein [Bacillus sp. JJ1562]|uniref:LiaG family protein n=1 Tax=Bacillus sp. JJ1562 TaxID=3122960 RepID=UPI003003263F
MKKILIIFFVLIGAYLLITNLYRIPGLPFGNSGDSAKVTEKIDEIEIDISSISTTVIPENRDDVEAELKGKGEVHVSKSGDKIEVTYERGFFNWGSLPFFNNSKLTVYIPEDYDQDLSFRVGSGHLEFDGASMEINELSADVHSGNMRLENLTVETFTHNVASGNSSIDKLTTKSGEIDVRSGNVTVDEYIGKLEAEVHSGRLKTTISDLTDSIDASVNSGLLDLDLPNDADFILKGKSNSGHISNNFSLDDSTRDKGNIEGKHGAGTYDINIEVNSGIATIR